MPLYKFANIMIYCGGVASTPVAVLTHVVVACCRWLLAAELEVVACCRWLLDADDCLLRMIADHADGLRRLKADATSAQALSKAETYIYQGRRCYLSSTHTPMVLS